MSQIRNKIYGLSSQKGFKKEPFGIHISLLLSKDITFMTMQIFCCSHLPTFARNTRRASYIGSPIRVVVRWNGNVSCQHLLSYNISDIDVVHIIYFVLQFKMSESGSCIIHMIHFNWNSHIRIILYIYKDSAMTDHSVLMIEIQFRDGRFESGFHNITTVYVGLVHVKSLVKFQTFSGWAGEKLGDKGTLSKYFDPCWF